MGRPHRPLVAGAYYHVVARGNDRAPIVLDGEDRIVFFHLLRRVERRYGWRLHARCPPSRRVELGAVATV